MKIRPLRDRLWVQKDEPESMTAGGIIIPDEVQDKPMTGVVLATGPGAVLANGVRLPMDVQAGDRIVFKRYDGINATVRGVPVFVVPAHDVMAIIVEE